MPAASNTSKSGGRNPAISALFTEVDVLFKIFDRRGGKGGDARGAAEDACPPGTSRRADLSRLRLICGSGRCQSASQESTAGLLARSPQPPPPLTRGIPPIFPVLAACKTPPPGRVLSYRPPGAPPGIAFFCRSACTVPRGDRRGFRGDLELSPPLIVGDASRT